jgi:hypothetical protein
MIEALCLFLGQGKHRPGALGEFVETVQVVVHGGAPFPHLRAFAFQIMSRSFTTEA